MIALQSVVAGLFAVSGCLALSVNISGVVTDTTGAPLQGVAVKLIYAGLTATSATDGSFTIKGSVAGCGQNAKGKLQANRAAFGNGCVRVILPGASAVAISVYTLHGKAVYRSQALMAAGAHAIALPRLGAGVYLYTIKAGVGVFTMKSPTIDGVSRGTGASFQGPSTVALLKKTGSGGEDTDAVLAAKQGYLSYVRKVSNSDIEGMEMVIAMPAGFGVKPFGVQRPIVMKDIPAGTFTMGSDSLIDEAQPSHQVTLSAFTIQETHVTQEQYLAVMGTNPSYCNTGTDASLRPVECVDWDDAIKFCNALSLLSGFNEVYDTVAWTADFSKTGFRLPTEAQWEYACRAGATTEYWWGPDTIGLGARAWDYNNSEWTTHRVATKLPNAYGLYDMAGNVEQWCNDWYGAYAAGSANDPTGASVGDGHVVRGGSWELSPQCLRCAYRNGDYRLSSLGFRCVFSR